MRIRLTGLVISLLAAIFCCAQISSQERTFSKPASALQEALKKLPGGVSGSLPMLDGFVVPGTRSLDRYKRPYYRCAVHITPTSSGSLVRVIAKITAWNSDPAHSGYEVLPSNGRIESDLLDRLQDLLASNSAPKPSGMDRNPKMTIADTGVSGLSSTPQISAPTPQFPAASAIKAPVSSSSSQNPALEREAESLEEILRNQSHPTNLIAAKADQTPVLQNPSSNSKVLFYANVEDEFEVLDSNPEWVHVRISGLSRGWLRRSSVEMLNGSETSSETATNRKPFPSSPGPTTGGQEQPGSDQPKTATLFSVSSEEDGNFPGDWTPLKGKTVKIISIQQVPGTGRITSPQDKMRFAASEFKKEILASSSTTAGLVLIFDAEDGGMIAATRSALDQWKSGSVSEQAFWKQCYLDPPEILGTAN